MSFIAKNPLTMPEVESSPSVPKHGTRGLFAGKDGWYEISPSGEKKKLSAIPVYAYVNILGGIKNWILEEVADDSGNVIGSRYGQVVNVNNAEITPNSKVDLQITSEQMVVFYEKSLAFVAENDNGVVTIYCVGSVPEHNYTVQAIVTEVVVND